MSLSDRGSDVELAAMLAASALATTRAGTGRYPDLAAIRAAVGEWQPSPGGLRLLEGMGMPDGTRPHAGGWLAAVPALHIGTPVVNVGLGDCFTAGLLAMT